MQKPEKIDRVYLSRYVARVCRVAEIVNILIYLWLHSFIRHFCPTLLISYGRNYNCISLIYKLNTENDSEVISLLHIEVEICRNFILNFEFEIILRISTKETFFIIETIHLHEIICIIHINKLEFPISIPFNLWKKYECAWHNILSRKLLYLL